jgi:hypothetical protein
MHPSLVSLISSVLLISGVATPALAQEAAKRELDWVLTEIPERKAILAMADFDIGLSFATRCMDGQFDVTIHGLPEARGMTRALRITVNDEESYESSWIIGTQRTTAFSRVPVRFARELAKGGTLQTRVPGERNKPATRYVIDLPPSVSAVEQTLTSCGKSLVDLRYDTMLDENLSGLPQGLVWKNEPRFSFPSPSGPMMSTVGYVSVSCGVTPELRPTDCQIESEYPAGFNFGREVLRKVSSGQLKLTGENESLNPQATILFNVNFRMY